MNNILLSICIPTFNRAAILDKTLDDLTSNSEFEINKIEVIISDNCSTDNTREVVSKYPQVKYFVNEFNIKDYNFTKALSYSTGKYIRLFNDTVKFNPGALSFMLNVIEENFGESKNLFFYQNMFLNQNCSQEITQLKEYFFNTSFFSTWIANFGIWRADFEKLENKDCYSELQFPQLYWSYQTVKNGKNTIIHFSDYFTVTVPNKKGGYNIFNTFVNKYLLIVKKEKLSIATYELEKYRLFKNFIYPWLLTLLVNEKEEYSYDVANVWNILFSKYWYEPYFYFLCLKFLIHKIKL
mgnify:CR=1 FL=1